MKTLILLFIAANISLIAHASGCIGGVPTTTERQPLPPGVILT